MFKSNVGCAVMAERLRKKKCRREREQMSIGLWLESDIRTKEIMGALNSIEVRRKGKETKKRHWIRGTYNDSEIEGGEEW